METAEEKKEGYFVGFFVLFFRHTSQARWILVPRPGIEPVPPCSGSLES